MNKTVSPAKATWLICLALALAVWAVFGQTRHFDFVNYDDNLYVYADPVVEKGLTLHGIGWAFTHALVENWHPLTVVSYMTDCQLYGLKPGGYHLTNVLLHTAAVILLFLALKEMSAAPWRSAFVAAVFAVHPLHVESVAWISERKDVLSGMFFMLTLWTYVRYVRRSSLRVRYLWVMIALALGLMSKPMLVTVPFVLLLLDYWPLGRVHSPQSTVPNPEFRVQSAECGVRSAEGKNVLRNPVVKRLFWEKIPFLALAGATCLVTLVAQKQIIATPPLALRISNAILSCATYVWQMFWPAGLAPYYPYPDHGVPLWRVASAFAFLAVVTVLAFVWRGKRPWLLVGWLWYLGMLVPVIGVVQSGLRAHADRYTYLPQIGLYIVAAWGMVELCGTWRHRRLVLGAAAAVILAGLTAGAYVQTGYWKDSLSLWQHEFACTPESDLAQNNWGEALAGQKKWAEAIPHYERSLQLNSRNPTVYHNLGVAFAGLGKFDEAIQQYRHALQLQPDDAAVHCSLGIALAKEGKLTAAIQECQRAVQLDPEFAEGHYNLGYALAGEGRWDEAIRQYQQALELQPDFPEAHHYLGVALAARGNLPEAIQHFQEAIQLQPNFAEAHFNLGVALAGEGKPAEAISEYEQAVQLKPDFAEAYDNLGIALAMQGRMADAMADFERAVQLQPNFAEANYNLGLAMTTEGRWTDAIKLLERALKLKPDYAVAHLNLGLALIQVGKTAEAIPHLERAEALATAQGNAGLAAMARARMKAVVSSH